MYPEINLGFVQFSAYSFFTLLALIVAVIGIYSFSLKRGFARSDILWMLISMSVAVFLGARLFNVLINIAWYMENPSRIVALSFTGFSLYGGMFAAVLTGLIVSRTRKIDLFKFADTSTPFVGMGIVLMRVGCFLNGCCFGKVTDLPWGVTFPMFSPAHIHQMQGDILGSTVVHAVHPTQLYEMIAAIFGTLLAFYLLKKKMPSGSIFLICGIYFSVFRLLNMQLRVLPYSESVLTFWYPLFYLAVIILCAVLLKFLMTKKNEESK